MPSKRSSLQTNQPNWTVQPVDPPVLATSTWQAMNVLAVLLAIMATLQLSDFVAFSQDLNTLGVGSSSFWPSVVCFAEFWAIACLLRLPLSKAFRMVSSMMLIAVAAFWFLLSVSAVVQDNSAMNFAIFGSFTDIKADWLMVLFTAGLLAACLWAANLVKGGARKTSKVKASRSVSKSGTTTKKKARKSR